MAASKWVASKIEEMLMRLRAGDARAIARAISILEERGPDAHDLLTACRHLVNERASRPLRIGVTGAPGAGKSTLVDQMARLLRRDDKTVGIVAVDPSSPITGGALLGDRIRMQGFSGDKGVSIRSMASRGLAGGVGRTAEGACLVMEAAGKDVVLLETVGVGQDEVAIAAMVDVVILVLVPGMGDDVQTLKAGVMEIANIFCINKSDRPGAERVEAEIAGMQALGGVHAPRPVVKTISTTGEGVQNLLELVTHLAERKSPRLPPSQFNAGAFKIDHLGIAVREIAQARLFYEQLGMTIGKIETVAHEGVKVAMIDAGESRIELLEPIEADTTIGRFVARRGEGIHHLALRAPRLDQIFTRLASEGVSLASDAVKIGAGGHRYFFVHPSSTGGVLMELVEETA